MPQWTCKARTSDGFLLRVQFSCSDTPGPGEVVFHVDRASAPDRVLDRYDAGSPDGLRTATAGEQASAAIALADEAHNREMTRGLRALAQATFELKMNAWTAQEFRDRIQAIYRTP